MGDITKFRIERAKEVQQPTIKAKWEEIRVELQKEYDTSGLLMPEIRAFILAEEDYDKKHKEIQEHPVVEDTGEEEYGVSNIGTRSSALTLPLNKDKSKWAILICEGRKPLEIELEHELKHAWEHLLGLKWGALQE